MMLDGFIHPTKKPDIDNATKLILDSLNGVAWKDDNQVCFQCAMKIYSEQPCVRVIIEGKKPRERNTMMVLYGGLYSRSLHRYWSFGI